ncbi:hypothetical protein PRIPAC_77564 [Pristionchus pacificus]|uniref:C-type lectin n=1 Tax=Pristionchus pacificus TaxID=54126 RepID=A0A2A6CJZ5_PRIPA|nr:hypothetical protein PRIPAC_77564 [Pristionchus pacificus]|eukprot:PDM78449.1 C-type lectin [Pristionchus pacificus]
MGAPDSLVILLLLTVGTAHAYVFSCEEVKYKLLNTDFEVSTQFACLITRQGSPLDFVGQLEGVFVRADNVSTSFKSLATDACAERPGTGSWRIVSDLANPMSCSDGAALIFTSTRPTINVVSASYPIETLTTVLANGDEQLIGNEDHGMNLRVKECTGAGNITFYTGAGVGEEEQRFLLKSWRCADLSPLIISFDTVITIAVDSDVRLTLEYRPNDLTYGPGALAVTPVDRITVMASGRSDNLLNLYGYNYANFKTGNELTVSASCDPCSFDPQFDGFVQLLEFDADYNIVSQEKFREPGTYAFNFERQLQIEYKSNTVSPKDIWDRQDTFVVELSFSEPAKPTAPQEIVEEDPFCACKLDEKNGVPSGWSSNEIWLDVVVVLDTSEAMSQQSLADASTLIESFVATDVGLATDPHAKFYTRVGVIAMADEPLELYNLNMTTSDTILDKVQIKKGVSQIDILYAYIQAKTMLNKGVSRSPDRENTRQVVYYMSASTWNPKDDFQHNIEYFKEDGIIIVNDFKVPGEVQTSSLFALASDGYYYTDTSSMHSMQLLCRANCFCRADKTAYRNPSSDPAGQASGGCLLAQPTSYPFSKARDSCTAAGGGRLVSVHDADKAHALLQLMFNAAPKTFYYWMGYSKSDDGTWKWEDNSTLPYSNWDVNEPSAATVSKCAYVDIAEQGLFWGAGNCNINFPSACEFAPCAAGNQQC